MGQDFIIIMLFYIKEKNLSLPYQLNNLLFEFIINVYQNAKLNNMKYIYQNYLHRP